MVGVSLTGGPRGPPRPRPRLRAVERQDAAPSEGCPRWCVLPAPLFPNGLQYFQHRVPQETAEVSKSIYLTWRWIEHHQPRCPLARAHTFCG